MTLRRSILLHAPARFFVAVAVCSSAGLAAAETTPLASVQLIAHPANASPTGLPADGPKVVLYFKKNASAPGCGLLPPGSSQITPLLEPDPGEDFPQCTGVTAATSFRWHGRAAYVVRFLQRDTREDTTSTDTALIDGPSGLEAIAGLEASAMPTHASIATVASWVKAQLVSQGAEAGFKTSSHDVATTDTAFLAVARDGGKGSCRLTAGSLADNVPSEVVAPCAAVLATTGFSMGPTSWFVAMLQGPDHHPVARVFSVDAHAAGEATDLEAKLAATASGGKIVPVRDALRRLVKAR